MSPTVIDASVLAKLGFMEPGSSDAHEQVAERGRILPPLHAPDLVFAELASIGLKKIGLGEGTIRESRELIDLAMDLPLEIWPCRTLAHAALGISLALGTSPYDSLYLAVVERTGGTLLTADRRLVSTLEGTPLEGRVEVLEGSW